MTLTLDSQRTRGMRDLLPEAMARFRQIERRFGETLVAWGYQEVRTPTLEHLHLFTSAGTLAPQALERVYSFLDWDGWSGERVVLRPDATIPAARVYHEQMAGGIAKLFYVTNVFRFASGDEPREQWQCGAEVIGETWPGGDLELITAGSQLLASLGIAGVQVRLSHSGVLRALLSRAGYRADEQADQYDRLLDGDLNVLRDVEQRIPELQATLHLLTDVKGDGPGYLANVRAAFGSIAPELDRALDELMLVVSAVAALRVPVEIDLTLVRDFEYYTGPVFRFVLEDGTDLGGGGRYDALVRDGDRTTPACGFALSMDALLAVLPQGVAPDAASVLTLVFDDSDAQALALAVEAASALQAAGHATQLVASADSQMRTLLTIDPSLAAGRYRLRRHPDDTGTDYDQITAVVEALGSAPC